MSAELLPVGTYVLVQDPGCWDTAQRRMILAPSAYYGRVVGYDVFRTKYELGTRYPGWGRFAFLRGGSWVAPSWCAEVTEREALTAPHPEVAERA